MFERENAFAIEFSKTVELTGSEKQISWAKDIVRKFAFVSTSATFKTAQFEDAKKFVAWAVKKHPSAKWWIDNRDGGYRFYDRLVEEWEDETEGM